MAKQKSEILIYQPEDGNTQVEVRLQDETVWLSQKLMAELFQKDVRTINEHIKNVYFEGELEPETTIRKFRIVQTEGKHNVSRDVDHYNLDIIISVGYWSFLMRFVVNVVNSFFLTYPDNQYKLSKAYPPSLCFACSILAGFSFLKRGQK